MLLPLSICGRKMSISRLNCLEMPFYSKWMFPSKDCLQTFDGRASTLSMLWNIVYDIHIKASILRHPFFAGGKRCAQRLEKYESSGNISLIALAFSEFSKKFHFTPLQIISPVLYYILFAGH